MSDSPKLPALPVTLIAWRPIGKGALVGFASVQLGKSLRILDCPVLMAGGRRWATLPSKPMVDRSGTALRDEHQKIRYAPVLEWADRPARDRFSDAVCAAVERQHPQAFADHTP